MRKEKMHIKKIDVLSFKKYKNDIIECVNELVNYSTIRCNKIIKNMEIFLNDKSAIIYSAIYEEKLIGFIWGYLIDNQTIHINYFVVNKNYRNNGIGGNLLNKMIDNNMDINCFELLVNINNYKGIKFYQKNGFIKNEYNKDKYKMILERLK